MKEIKFRAWDTENKRMSAVVDLHFFTGGIDITVEEDEENWLEEPDFILMQYTGLKDRNGVEIYEGDILTTGDGVNWEMLWNDKSVAWDMRSVNPKCNPPMKEAWMSPWIPESLEVIGNKYLNPELLTT